MIFKFFLNLIKKILWQSEEQWFDKFHKSKQTVEEYIQNNVDKSVSAGLQQGFRMLRITLSEWNLLDSEQKTVLNEYQLQQIKPSFPVKQYSNGLKPLLFYTFPNE